MPAKGVKFEDKEVLDSAKAMSSKKEICDNCLGRQFAQVLTGMTNRQRGGIIRGLLKIKKESKYCEVCDDLFKGLDGYAEDAIDKLKQLDFKTFVVGTRISQEYVVREESVHEFGSKYSEPIKSEINRELGKLISKKLEKIKVGIEPDEENPDVLVLFDLDGRKTRIGINPLFVYGKYKKLVRGLPQTKWDTYKETVEDLIAKPFMRETKGMEHALHGMGREDIDARCLDWRPFVFEVTKPRNRSLDLKAFEKEINKSKKIQVSELRFSTKQEVRDVKAAKPDKSYKVLVEFEKAVSEKDLQKLKKLKGKVIEQQTPERVMHRRADLMRPRKVKEISWILVKPKKSTSRIVEFEVKGEAGLYVKELVHGDSGRTKPSISELLANPAKVLELDVIKIWVK